MRRTKTSWKDFWGTVTDKNVIILIDVLQNDKLIRKRLEEILHSKRGSESKETTKRIVDAFLMYVLPYELLERYKE